MTERKHKKLWWHSWKVYTAFIGVAISVITFYSSVYDTFNKSLIPTHVHSYSCYNKFIETRKLEIPENFGIPAIVHLQINIADSESMPENDLLAYYMNVVITLLETKTLAYTLAHTELPGREEECIIHMCEDMMKDLTLFVPDIIEGDIQMRFFASKDSVDAAKVTLADIHNTTFRNKMENITKMYKFSQYGGAITITLEESEYGLKIDTDFNYRIDGDEVTQARKAYNRITFHNKQTFYTEKDGRTYSFFFPLKIDSITRKVCVKCHSLEDINEKH